MRGSPREGARSEERAEQRLAAGGRRLPRPGAYSLLRSYADILRFYLGEVRTIFGEARLQEKVRYNTGSAGPGGF
jgi:hypothetical protein